MTLPVGVVIAQPIFDSAPFASCHAATLVETSAGNLACAFFGGSKEGKDDVCIWLSHRRDGKWSAPEQVGDGVQLTGERFACWNPVLFRPRGGPVMLFFKVGPSPSKWWGMLRTSDDDGKTWSHPVRLPEKILGPAKNKPIQLDGGDILSPCSAEDPTTGWHVYFERSSDGGTTWSASEYVAQGDVPKVTQPTILVHSPTTMQALGRTTVGRLFETWSRDAGRTWEPIRLIDLPNCNSGIDAVTLRVGPRAGAHLLVYNHSNLEKVRYPLNVAFSRDGREWLAAAQLESDPPGQYSYPAIIQTSDGLVHIAYTFKRRTIKHVVIDPSKLELRPIDTFVCPPPGSPTHRSDEFQ
jgi:predicted neuraminidase